MKKKILYFMHVDWHWIKQRPHFLAEQLSVDFDMLVAHPYSNRRSHLVRNETSLFRVPMLSLPLSRFKFIDFINRCAKSLQFWALFLAFRPSIVWFTFPTMVPQFGLNLLKDTLIIYDCMDDAPEFTSVEAVKQDILRKEKFLISYAKLIVVSSENLYKKIAERGAGINKLTLVRNAFGGEINDVNDLRTVEKGIGDTFRILYFGAVSDYLDFELLLHALNNFEGVEFHFFGPITTDIPAHRGLHFHGPISHFDLMKRAMGFDCFLMPFIVNELIQGVDPVKLYEYINLNKNIICPHYNEINRFSEFVSFYRNEEEFLLIVKKLMLNNVLKYNSEQRLGFLEMNCWPVRVTEVTKSINYLLQ